MLFVKEKKKLLRNFHMSRKGKTTDKVPCVRNLYNRKIRLLTMCHASILSNLNMKFRKFKYINLGNQLYYKKSINRSFIMLNSMMENENTSFASISISFLRSRLHH